MIRGTITRVCLDRGFAFATNPGRADTFILYKDLDLNTVQAGSEVEYDIHDTPKGPRAFAVRVL